MSKRERPRRNSQKNPFTHARSPTCIASTAPKFPQRFPYHLPFYQQSCPGEMTKPRAWRVKAETLNCTLHSAPVLRAGHRADVLAVLIVAKRGELIAAFCAGVFGMCGLAEWSGGQECIGHPGQSEWAPPGADGKGKFAVICSSQGFEQSTGPCPSPTLPHVNLRIFTSPKSAAEPCPGSLQRQPCQIRFSTRAAKKSCSEWVTQWRQ